MKKAILLLVVFLSTTKVINAQTIKSDGVRLRILRLNHVGKTYKLNTEDSTLTYFRYLGKVRTAHVGAAAPELLKLPFGAANIRRCFFTL